MCSINAGLYYLQEHILSFEDENGDLYINYTDSMLVVTYFGTQTPEIEKLDEQTKIKSADLHGKDLTESEPFHNHTFTTI